jgi:HEPN/RES N-terminal domain 1
MVSINVRPVTPPRPSIYDLADEALKEAIKEWFFNNYEDPVHSTPYDSREGGYQYIWGGPYETRDIFEQYLGELSENISEEIIAELEDTTDVWTVSQNRLYDEDPPERTAYEELQTSLNKLEDALENVRPISSSIGGNNPPEHIGVPPYYDEDRRDIIQAIHILRAPEDELKKDSAKVEGAAEKIRTVGEKLLSFLKSQGQLFSDAFSTELGKRAAQGLAAIGVWQILAGRLMETYEAVKNLLSTVLLPF